MKTKLLFFFLFLPFLNYAQTPINSFYTGNGDAFALVTSNTPLVQTGTGNQVWNFNQLVVVGTTNYANGIPTVAQITTYPNSTAVILTNSTSNAVTTTSQVFIKDISSVVSITGLLSSGSELNFITNNATLGAFPMNYGFTNNDPVAGTYVYTTYSGTFTGNIVTSVDAYGTLNTNIGSYGSSSVTRLKTVITLSLNYIFPGAGTITQTAYSYYSPTKLLFRTATTTIVVPMASINQTDTTIESYMATLSDVAFSAESNQLQIAPNPVNNQLQLGGNFTVLSIAIFDASGRIVFSKETQEKVIDVSQLQKGVYFAKIVTNTGTISKKIIKN